MTRVGKEAAPGSLDKLVDALIKGKSMQKILRK